MGGALLAVVWLHILLMDGVMVKCSDLFEFTVLITEKTAVFESDFSY